MARKSAPLLDHESGEEIDDAAEAVELSPADKAPCTALAIAQTRDVATLYSDGSVKSLIEKIKAEMSAKPRDISTEEGRAEIRSTAYQLAKRKTWFDQLGKKLTEAEKKKIDRVNAERRLWREELTAIHAEYRRPLTEWEQADEDRIAAHSAAITAIEALVRFDVAEPAAAHVEGRLAQLAELEARDWQEFRERASFVVADVRDRLADALRAAQRREADAAELAELRAARAERERVDRIKDQLAAIVESPDFGNTETADELRLRLHALDIEESRATSERWAEFLPAAMAAIASERDRARRFLAAAEAAEAAARQAAEAEAARVAAEAERAASAERERLAAEKAAADLAEANRRAEEAEAARVASHRAELARMEELAHGVDGAAYSVVFNRSVALNSLLRRDWQEFAAEAGKLAESVRIRLGDFLFAAERREEEQANAEKAARERAADEQAAREREQGALIERRRQEQAEREEREAAERREANLNHRRKINNEAVAKLIEHAGLSEGAAKAAVEAIAKKLVPNVTISY